MAEPRLGPRAAALAGAGQSDFWAIPTAALIRARAGEPVLLLSLGDPVDPPHPAITRATVAALEAGRTHYGPLLGEPALRAAVAAAEGADPANVAIVAGAQHGVFATLMLLAGPGDEVLLSDPHYATYPGVVAAAGARAVPVPAPLDRAVDFASLAAAITPATRVILLTSPANPTGAALTRADFAELSALCERRGLWLVVDEVYRHFGADGPPPGAWVHGPRGRTVVVNSLSKSHAMTGYRIGWVVAPEPLVTAFDDWAAAAHFGVSQFVQDGAIAALAVPEAELAGYRAGFRERARQVVARANAIPGLAARLPAGGMFVMVSVAGTGLDDLAFAERLFHEESVALVPGRGFGAGGAGHVRVSLTPDAATLDAAFDRIGALVARLGRGRMAS
ncbi:MAG: pyridoxal phosphate-dependent aminotransferase [Sphingomonadaceae bacterium]